MKHAAIRLLILVWCAFASIVALIAGIFGAVILGVSPLAIYYGMGPWMMLKGAALVLFAYGIRVAARDVADSVTH